MEEIKQINSKQIKVEYEYPPFYRRVLANVIDAIFFALVFFSLFIGTRAIVTSTSKYQTTITEMATIKVDSCLYIPNDLSSIADINDYINSADKYLPDEVTDITDIVSVLNDDNMYGSSAKISGSQSAIVGFLNYCEVVCEPEDYQEILADYHSFMLSDELTNSSGDHYFVLDNQNEIVINENCEIEREIYFYTKGYAPYIDEHAQGYLITRVPNYYDCAKYLSNVLVFIEIPISYLLSGLIIYLLPIFIFRRGRMTFGKAIYHVGCIDSRLLSPKIGLAIARFSIFYFAELILSLFTVGIPFLISFTMMVFSKKKQGFPDYMLGIIEVNTYRTKIYMSKEEIALKGIDTHAKPVDFKVRRGL
ncbi:MAG: RDD family protein [Erysipelotrichaceae bacterium]|nr:RDD family protein [Erysipelotrichaceae bacterium]